MRIPTFNQFQRQVSIMSKEFDTMGRLYQQASSGKKLVNASDDPTLAYEIDSKENYLSVLDGYNDNGSLAEERSELVNSTIQNMANIMTDVQGLLQKSENGTLNDHDRYLLGEQLQGNLNNLVQLANTRDANNAYVFSGTNAGTPAFQLANGHYQYTGGSDTMSVNIAPETSVPFSVVGGNYFGGIYNGNGTFQIQAASGNTGTAMLTAGTVNSTTYVPDTYTVQVVTNAQGDLAYAVTGATSGQVIPAAPATIPQNAPAIQAGQALMFNGVTVNLQGAPAAGDSFTIQPSTTTNLFDALQTVITTLKTPVTNAGSYNQAITQSNATVKNVMNQLTDYQSHAGATSAQIKSQLVLNKNIATKQTIAISELGDIDIPSVYSALSQQSLILQATQESYLKMQAVLEKILQI